jgi:hypothetical protein
MAYYYVKKAYEPVALSLKYSSQVFDEKVSFELWINSSHKVDSDSEAYVNVYNLSGELLYSKTYRVDALEAEKAAKLAKERIWTEEKLVIVRINSSLNKVYNEYIFVKGDNLEGLRYIDKTNIQVDKGEQKLKVKNIGEKAALFVYVNKPADNNYIILLPQEERKIQLLSSVEEVKVAFFNQ